MADSRRKILITGATSGIGLALARRLVDRHDVLVAARKTPQEAKALLPDGCAYVQADFSEPAAASQVIASHLLKAGWTKLDNVVINAGVGFVTDDGCDTPARVRQTLDINLTASILLARALYPWLQKASGTLTLVGSVAHKGQAMFPAYAASKAGLHGFARALRSEWAGRVAVQIIHPGPTRTDMHQKAGFDPGKMADFFLKPDSVALMMERAIASKRSPVTCSFARLAGGGTIVGRSLS
ncbi:MAG: SDR family oxidoreductase [Ahrensia sp.]